MTETNQRPSATEEIDAYLLGDEVAGPSGAAAREQFEARMQSDLNLALAVAQRVAFYQATQSALQAPVDAVHPPVQRLANQSTGSPCASSAREALRRDRSWWPGISLATLAAALVLTVSAVSRLDGPPEVAPAASASGPPELRLVASNWLAMLDEHSEVTNEIAEGEVVDEEILASEEADWMLEALQALAEEGEV